MEQDLALRGIVFSAAIIVIVLSYDVGFVNSENTGKITTFGVILCVLIGLVLIICLFYYFYHTIHKRIT